MIGTRQIPNFSARQNQERLALALGVGAALVRNENNIGVITMSEFLIKPRKSPMSKPTVKVGQVILTTHGNITILEYVNNKRVQIKFADEYIKPNPEWVTVRAIRKIEIKPKGKN